jgi:uncharacterized protein (TIGR02186 family)
MRKFRILMLLIFGLLILNPGLSDKASAELTVDANHNHIKIDFFYHGDMVNVKGVSDIGADIIIKVTSSEGHQVLRKKGKMAGLLWMNVGELRFEHAPDIYFLHSTKRIEDILSNEEMAKYAIGYSALKEHIEITPVKDEADNNKWFNEFVRFKESSSLYSASVGKISTEVKNRKQDYYIKLNWPYHAPPGNYTLTIYAVKEKKVIEKAEANIKVEQVGGVKALAEMARNNGALYGIISIAAALTAGFGVSMVFRKGGGGH